jgi:acylpyruvate hydrolase
MVRAPHLVLNGRKSPPAQPVVRGPISVDSRPRIAGGQTSGMGIRLATIRVGAATAAVRVDSDVAVETGHPSVGELLLEPEWRSIAEAATGRQHEAASLDFAPLVPRPSMTICVGLNYLDHIAETGREKPQYPTLFAKYPRTLIGAFDPIEMPAEDESTEVDWEAELGVVIGTEVRRASAAQAAEAIAGYTVVNDVSVRDYQYRSTQFLQGKMWEGTTPVGPYLVTTEPGEPAAFPIQCIVDGQVMQDSNTSELCFGPVDLVKYISTLITLTPGDLIVTGTPGGVGHARNPKIFLTRGQTVVTRIDGIGECRNVCR